jgi:hypothetical protein
MLDLGAVNASGLEAERIVRDCELVADAVRNNPERMRLMVEAQSKGDFQTARQIGNEIGLTEEQLIESGGGLALLILVAVIAFAASGEHCHASHEPHDR